MQRARPHIFFGLMVLMLASLFLSRALLSISVFAFAALAVLLYPIKERVRAFLSQPLLWAISLLFFLPLLSGAWSHDRQQWWQMMQVKAPLLVLPFACALPFSFPERYWRLLAVFFIACMLGAAGWTLWHFAGDMQAVNAAYLRAATMVTPLQNDHVRFSWLVFAAILVTAVLFHLDGKKTVKWLWLACFLAFIVFLHLLAARTGLLAFYAGLLLVLLDQLRRKDPRFVTGGLLLLLLLPILAWFSLPSFRNKLRYLNHEKNYFLNGGYIPHSNDGVRMISIRAGWEIMNKVPAGGTGYGDILPESRQWYAVHYPQMEEADKIYPSSQFLLYGAGTGWPGLLLFAVVLLLPFFERVSIPLPWRVLNLGMGLSFLFDIGLEVQYGVFIYLFFVLSARGWLKQQNQASLQS